jgi:hypothetical protein
MTATEKTVAGTPAIERFALFGAPPLLDGEDAASYNEFLGRVCAAVKPVDVIDEMFVADIVFQQWEILRLRRVKTSLLRVPGHHALQEFLSNMLSDRRLCADVLASNLTTILKTVPNVPPVDVERLAQRCARNKNALVYLTARPGFDILGS